MEFSANEGKVVRIEVGERTFLRHAVKTHFVTLGEDYIELVRQYVLPLYQPGDILSCSEKIIALCQKRVVMADEVKPSWLAKTLCKFVHQTAAGPGAGVPEKMQFAINHCGAMKVLWAAFRAALDKLRGVKGTFYRITGPEITGLDGFYGGDIEEYASMGIRIPENPDGVCDEVFAATGVKMMIVDANALTQELLGKCAAIEEEVSTLEGMIKDNPAGQEKQLTPFILIREIKTSERSSKEVESELLSFLEPGEELRELPPLTEEERAALNAAERALLAESEEESPAEEAAPDAAPAPEPEPEPELDFEAEIAALKESGALDAAPAPEADEAEASGQEDEAEASGQEDEAPDALASEAETDDEKNAGGEAPAAAPKGE